MNNDQYLCSLTLFQVQMFFYSSQLLALTCLGYLRRADRGLSGREVGIMISRPIGMSRA